MNCQALLDTSTIDAAEVAKSRRIARRYDDACVSDGKCPACGEPLEWDEGDKAYTVWSHGPREVAGTAAGWACSDSCGFFEEDEG